MVPAKTQPHESNVSDPALCRAGCGWSGLIIIVFAAVGGFALVLVTSISVIVGQLGDTPLAVAIRAAGYAVFACESRRHGVGPFVCWLRISPGNMRA